MIWGKKGNRNLIRENNELRVRIQKLEEENSYLKFMLEEFRGKVFGRRKRKDKSKNKEDGEGGTGIFTPKTPGAPKGHSGWFRKKPDNIDHVEEIHLKK